MTLEGRLRLFILGAGFSVAAGLPLSAHLWNEVQFRARRIPGRAEKFFDDLNDYIAFRRDSYGDELTSETVNFEDFMRYLDVEHYLGLRGSDTWSDEGNEGTVVTKTLIGKILSERQPVDIPRLYLEFARNLRPHDWVLTFNYDSLLECALDAIGKPYRLTADRITSSGTVDDDQDVVVLKLHGSIDWFDRKRHEKAIEVWRKHGNPSGPESPIFSHAADLDLCPLANDQRPESDPLATIYRCRNVWAAYQKSLLFRETPIMLPPSHAKLLYASRFQEFWRGMRSAGTLNTDVAVIGFSLPQQDDYAVQILHGIVTSFQRQYWDNPQIGRKRPLCMIDLLPDQQAIRQYKKRYRFVDWNKTHLCRTGFDMNALNYAFTD